MAASTSEVINDLPESLSLLQRLTEQVSNVTKHVQNLLHKVQDGEISTNKGVSFLEVKYQLLLSYLVNLTHTMWKKTGGKSLKNDPDIDRLVEIRTVLEKMRPIDDKLHYQIDKLVKTATTGNVNENDPLRFKPNPDNLSSKFDDESENEEDRKKQKVQKYVPPKLVAMPYDEEDTVIDQQQKKEEKAKKRALNSQFMRELREEYLDIPEEIKEFTDFRKMKEDVESKQRQQYEEEHFVRLPVTKQQKAAQKRSLMKSSLADLTSFGELSALTGAHDTDGSSKKRKKRSSKGKKFKGKKKKRF
ncbi:neuroguidin-A-like [Saccoglossus kowalevskii]|uniref:Neuroguidin-A-like n=1 Tax=Saccoglossus kowalevskii TaxID=10224 RepID=A0ABM0GKI4_SACKO|nr:PREDICTED: neuroguidin-A-like [Saccoglossus kowalevskii]